ncbi:HNH endonuclease [Virgibacillus halodenitrificans]|uniref:HNH endonuclease n=1 Tax=Virgibacillus halodenitrificans TaxID=1482 RepID=UPI001F0A036A|nr:HNH endonuclease [Virgibacillus halodenitrificans]
MLHTDHIIPLQNSGSIGDENLIKSCKSCNSSKNDKPLHVYLNDHINHPINPINIELITNNEKLSKFVRFKNGAFQPVTVMSRDGHATEEEREEDIERDKDKYYKSKIMDLLPDFSSIKNFNELNKRYWDVIRETRKTGKIAKSVIYNNMKKWKKYDRLVVEYALRAHVELHAGKKEEYTIGIMRNTSADEAKERMNYKNNTIPFKPKRPKEAEDDGYNYGF